MCIILCYTFNLFVICFVYSCIPLLQLEPAVQLQAYFNYNLAVTNMMYNYTSEKNLTTFLKGLKVAVQYFPMFSRSGCLFYSAVFVYNYIFIPCNLTAGTPRPLCSSACYAFRRLCNYHYTTIISYGNLLGIPLSDDCENTFHHINNLFHFPNSSKDFEDDCFDFPGSYVAIYIASYE